MTRARRTGATALVAIAAVLGALLAPASASAAAIEQTDAETRQTAGEIAEPTTTATPDPSASPTSSPTPTASPSSTATTAAPSETASPAETAAPGDSAPVDDAADVASDDQAEEGAPVAVDDVLFDWGLNEESSGGAYFGGCNFLSAGVAGDTGSSRLWTQADGFYRASDGDVSIVKGADDAPAGAFSTRCQTAAGVSVNGRVNAQADDDHTASRVRIAAGAGTVDVAANDADIAWAGSFTVAYYGGMTYWTATDPHLVVDDGVGTVTATLSGYAADMEDASVWGRLAPREVVIAELTDVTVTDDGFVVTPEYLGVAIPADVAGRNPQAERTAENAAWWGAFPADFQHFQQETGQSSYWFTTAGGATTIQPRKAALPLTVEFDAEAPVAAPTRIVSQPTDVTVAAGASAAFAVEAVGTDLTYRWERQERSGAWEPITDATSPAYAVPATAELHGTRYRVVVRGALGGPLTSNEVTLSIAEDGAGPGDGGAAPVQAEGAVFDWGINNESNGGAYFGGCNFLSAGVAGDAGGARVWGEGDGLYRATDGNTTIVRPTADGSSITPVSWASRCSTPTGTSVNGKTTAASDSYTQSRVRITGGTGTFDPAANTAAVSWTGSFTVAYYGGMTYWSASNPRLVVNADGTGTVTVSASGYGADMDDTSKWNRLEPRDVVIATLTDVEVTAGGLTATPDYLGVSLPADVSGRNAQAERTAANESWWGAFPADFVRFQMLTGQGAYWWTTEGSRSSIQPRKVTLPITVCASADCTVPTQVAADAPASIDLRQRLLQPPKVLAPPAPVAAPAVALAGAEEVVVLVGSEPFDVAAVAASLDRRVLAAAIALLGLLGLLTLTIAAGGVLVATGALGSGPPRRALP